MIQSLDSLNLFDFPFELNLIKIKHLEILNVWFQKISIPPLQGRGVSILILQEAYGTPPHPLEFP